MLFRVVTVHYIRLVEYVSSHRDLSFPSFFFLFFVSFFFLFAALLSVLHRRGTNEERTEAIIRESSGEWKLRLNLRAYPALQTGPQTVWQPGERRVQKRNVIELWQVVRNCFIG